MTVLQQTALLIPAAYLAGSIPFGLLVGLARGIDVRQGGSGNIGATNVGRLLGFRFFALVFLLDLLKGLLPMLAAGYILRGTDPAWGAYLLWLAVGLATILGHLFSIFLRFKGGKGVATSCGVALGVFPYYTVPAVVALIVWAVVFAAWRYVSLASITAAVVYPLAYLFIGLRRGWDVLGQQIPLLMFALAICAMVIIRHRANIARLRAGTEPKMIRRRSAAE